MTDAFILGGVRTPVGRYGGSLSHLRTDDLLGQTMVAACERVGVPLERIEDITAGCVNVAHEGMGDIARWGALAAGFPDSVPAVTVNRFCASSLTGAIYIAHAIRSDELGVGLAAGVESMSRSGWAQMKGDAPFSPRGPVLLLDTMWAGAGGPPNPVLLARDAYVEMIKTAQNVADRYEPHPRGDRRLRPALTPARRGGPRFGPVGGRDPPGRDTGHPQRAGPDLRARREHPGDTTAEQLAALRPVAQHHADDGRQLVGPQRRRQRRRPGQRGGRPAIWASNRWPGWWRRPPMPSTPSSWASPRPSPSPRPWGEPDWRPHDIDVWEVHEAFAAQALGVLRELPNQLDGFEVPDDRLNPNGGAVAIGHPFGSSGTRYVLTLATELHLRQAPLRRARRVRRLGPGRRPRP